MQLNLIGGARPGYGTLPRPIDGTVAGDVFRFKERAGAVEGELTVSGDEMNGSVTTTGAGTLFLRRVDSSAPPRSQ